MDIETLHKKALDAALEFHRSESHLIGVLQEVDDHKVFAKLKFSSLFDYCVKGLKLSESNASNFITIARKSKSVPELKIALDLGEITVSKARKITPVLTPENKTYWLDLAKELPKAKLEKEVAKVMPELIIEERARFVSESRIELKVGLREEIMQKLRRAQDLVSQKTKRAVNLEETLENLLNAFLERQDPLERAKRNVDETNADASVPRHTPGKRYLQAQLKHKVNLRDQGQCTHEQKDGERCQNRRWLEIHHKKPLSQGGENSLFNLQTLCSAHHRQEHM